MYNYCVALNNKSPIRLRYKTYFFRSVIKLTFRKVYFLLSSYHAVNVQTTLHKVNGLAASYAR